MRYAIVIGSLLLFTTAMTCRAQIMSGQQSGAPKYAAKTVATLPTASSNTNVVYLVTDGNASGDCTVGTGTTRVWCVSNGAAWAALGGSGSGTSAVLTNVNSGTFTATPSYSVSSSTVQVFNMPTLAGNVTSQTMTTTIATAGQIVQWIYLQDGTGGRTVVHPANLLNACAPDLGASKTTIISAVWNGTNALAFSCGTDANGFFLSPLAFSSYPTCAAGTKGMFGVVNDSSTTNIGATVTGGGSGNVAMFCNGTNWIAYGGTTLALNTSGTAGGLATGATKWGCVSPGLGDGLNAIAAGTYLQTNCYNTTGSTITLTSIKCFTDNSGTSTCNATNGAGTGLLTGAITATSAFAAGTQSGTTTIASGDFIKITFVADGTSKQFSMVFGGTY